ncbi:hypothetical protein BJ875DRAFT_487251 [Amylocarpus encephaloides]|uniref:Septum formation initiator domain-containing protein n=1 Tax=Amylocarpus encephaloides TaxID=45428 RepID=A0A9P7YCZ2_9HELO|nr:hypothetical protein BJ875DRAFT_487251 [Amylocarpus encephaloides]
MSGNYLPPLDTSKAFTAPISPTRRHQITRSISEVSPFPKLHRPHHHHHRHSHTNRHLKESEDVPQSTGPALQLNGDIAVAMTHDTTPNDSRDASRRTSALGMGWEDVQREREKRVVKEGEVEEEREKGAQRATQVRTSLLDLHTLSNSTTRRLDNTYYTVLEKLSALQNTISSMKELTGMTKTLNEEFEQESEEIASEVNGHLTGFGRFEEQERKITTLQERVKQGRDKVGTLGKRVHAVRERVEGWERAEFEWQEKTRKRMKMMWILMSAVAVVVVGLVFFEYTPAKPVEQRHPDGTNKSAIPDFAKLDNETWELKNRTSHLLAALRSKEGGESKEDARLKLFDEL